jgi:hypothetical protein
MTGINLSSASASRGCCGGCGRRTRTLSAVIRRRRRLSRQGRPPATVRRARGPDGRTESESIWVFHQLQAVVPSAEHRGRQDNRVMAEETDPTSDDRRKEKYERQRSEAARCLLNSASDRAGVTGEMGQLMTFEGCIRIASVYRVCRRRRKHQR